jgi:hypothetical protein
VARFFAEGANKSWSSLSWNVPKFLDGVNVIALIEQMRGKKNAEANARKNKSLESACLSWPCARRLECYARCEALRFVSLKKVGLGR